MRRGPSGADEGELVEVEVAPDTDPPGSDGPGRGTASPVEVEARPAASGRATRRTSVALVTVGVLVVGFVAGVNLAERRAVEQRRATLATIPGILQGDLGRPLERAWTVPGQWDWVVRAGDLLLLGSYRAPVVAGVDPADGTVRWRHEEGQQGGAWCSPMLREEDRRLELFLGYGISGLSAGAQALVLLCADSDTVRAIDVGTGAEIGTLPLLSLGTYAAVGDDLVVVSRDEEGAPQALRWSPLTGEVRWTADLSGVAPDRESDEVWGWGVHATDATIEIYTDRTLVLDPTDGSELPVTDAYVERGGVVVEVLADGATVVAEYSDSGERGTVREPGGTVRFELTGPPLPLALRDDAADTLVLNRTRAGKLAASDARTGELLWERDDLVVDGAALAVAGRVLVTWMGKVHALDQHTGRTVWEAEVPSSVGVGSAGAVSDGTHVLLPALGDGVLAAVSRRLDDGSEVWRAPVQRSVQTVAAEGGLVLAATPVGLEAWRAAPFPGRGD